MDHGDAVDEEDDVVAVVAVVGVDPELVDDLEVVFAPVADIHQCVGKRGAIVAGEVVFLAEANGIFEDVGGYEVVEQAGELGVGEADAAQCLELLAEVGIEGAAVADVGAVSVFEVAQLRDEQVLDALFIEGERPGIGVLLVGDLRRHGRKGVGLWTLRGDGRDVKRFGF